MYTEAQRENLLNQIVKYVCSNAEFEGILQIGSGAIGYTDLYSDIDLMAGCKDTQCVLSANEKLIYFFGTIGAVYIDKRRWSDTVLGLSVYFENGLSVDLSFMPTEELCIHAPQWKVLFSKSERFTEVLKQSARRYFEKSNRFPVDDSVHHRFIYALRRCEIAILRSEFVYADMALSEARQIILLVEAVREGKKIHQFKAYNTLDNDFLIKLDASYPVSRDDVGLTDAKNKLLTLYLETVRQCQFFAFDYTQLALLGVFE